MKPLILLITILPFLHGLMRDNNTGEAWGYVDVREGAHIFWWLYGQSANTPMNPTRPLVMWLQGGPGASSTGFGNLAEVGPLDENLSPRSGPWTTLADMLFVDAPVGSGFSYVEPPATYTSTESQIDEDLYQFLKKFLSEMPEYQNTPFYIFGESYGGKMGASFGVRLQGGIQSGDVRANLRGLILGDAWISPTDSVATWAPFLKDANLLSPTGFEAVSQMTKQTVDAADSGRYQEATELWKQTQGVIFQNTNNVNPFNIQQHNVPSCNKESTNALMNGQIRQKLQIIPPNVIWDSHRNDVFAAQSQEFMRPVINEVGQLLSSGLKVVIIQGQLDLLCDSPGTDAWIKKLPWGDLPQYLAAPLTTMSQGKMRRYKNLIYYDVSNAGHMVPIDKPSAGLEILQLAISD
eukprot:TCONS_00049089-protein